MARLARLPATGRTNPHLDTLGSYPDAEVTEAVTVTDPGHPLYGRQFALASAVTGPSATDHVHVAHRGGTVLRLAVAATSLGRPLSCDVAGTKLTLEAIHDLLRLAAEGGHACPSAPARSGQACPQTGAAPSSATSPPCSGR